MIAKQTLIDRFLLPVSLPHVNIIRKRIIKSCSDPLDETLSVTRAYDILFKTDLKDLLLNTWEEIALDDLTNTTSLEEISNSLNNVDTHVFPALREIEDIIPRESITILKELYSQQYPLFRVAVMVFIVAVTTLEDLL